MRRGRMAHVEPAHGRAVRRRFNRGDQTLVDAHEPLGDDAARLWRLATARMVHAGPAWKQSNDRSLTGTRYGTETNASGIAFQAMVGIGALPVPPAHRHFNTRAF